MRLAMLRIQRTLQNTRILVAAGILIIALFAIPIVTNQGSSPAPSAPSLTPAPSAPSLTPAPTAIPPTATPAYQPGTVVLGVGERTCALTPSGDQPALSLGDSCADVEARLRVPNSSTIWLSLTISDQPDLWLPLEAVAGDPAPPQLDQRGRFFGCTQEGETVCQVKVEINSAAYQVAVPLVVGGS